MAPGGLDSLPGLRSGNPARMSFSLSARANKKAILGQGRKKVGKLPYFLLLYGFPLTPKAGCCITLKPVFRTVRGPHRDGGDNAKKTGRDGTGPLAVVLSRSNHAGDCLARLGPPGPTR